MEIKLEDNVPLPNRRNHQVEETLRRIQVGQSFVDPIAKRDSNIWRDCANRMGIKVTVRRLTDGSNRIWRIE